MSPRKEAMFKLVYVTVGSDKTEYINMLRISVASAKKHMPQVPVVIVTDEDTLAVLRKYFSGGAELAAFQVPEKYNTAEKSRYLKDLFERTYIKDVLERHKIKNDTEVLEIF